MGTPGHSLLPCTVFFLDIPLAMASVLVSTLSPAQTGKFVCSLCLHPLLRRKRENLPQISYTTRSRRGLAYIEIRALEEAKETDTVGFPSSSAEEAAKMYGLEFGLWKILSSKEGGEGKEKSKTEQAKELLAKYGGAYLVTSITLSLISFSLCYLLVSAGIDVRPLLRKVGISTNEAWGKLGTFAMAYAAHKAASPVRFPPTVALTPLIASWIGKSTERDK